jgi:hypothetical protein
MILHLALFPVTWLYYRLVAYREARRAARGENTTEEEIIYDVDGSQVSPSYLFSYKMYFSGIYYAIKKGGGFYKILLSDIMGTRKAFRPLHI